jgi:hypothetical protein
VKAARILKPEEWGRLTDPQVPPLTPFVRSGDMAVCVVEDGEQIVGCVSVLRAVHYESLWVDEKRRGNAGVGRALLRQAAAVTKVWGAQWALGGIEDDRMRGFIERLGGHRVPLQFYALPAGGE